jgi:hypothetical protein
MRGQLISIKLPDTVTYVRKNLSQVIRGGIKNSLSSAILTTDSQVSERPNQMIGYPRPISITLIVAMAVKK